MTTIQTLKFKDGEEDGVYDSYVDVRIETVDNGFLVTYIVEGEEERFVYNYDSKGDEGPKGMFNMLIMQLGLVGRITKAEELNAANR